jgi:cbb3-type cytochrome oxidase subunit 3
MLWLFAIVIFLLAVTVSYYKHWLQKVTAQESADSTI